MCRFFKILVLFAIIESFLLLEAKAVKTVVTQRPYYNHYNNAYNQVYYPSNRRYWQNFTDMSALEQYVLNKKYTGESELDRLRRLEMLTFGAIQQGDFNTRYENVRDAILSRPQPQKTRSSVFRNVADYFAGQLTGFTPAIAPEYSNASYNDPYFEYQPTYGSNVMTETITPWGKKYRTQNYGTNSGAGIRILD